MHIETFGSPEEMVQRLTELREAANANLHPSQSALAFGSCWVRFVDPATNYVEFGRVASKEQVLRLAMRDGMSAEESISNLGKIEAMQEQGFLWGIAFSKYNLEGEWGNTHRANAWPIEERLLVMAQEVDYDITRLDEVGRILLQIAFAGARAHALSVAMKGESA